VTKRKSLTANQRSRLLLAAGQKCATCGASLENRVWHLDHVDPLEMGGADKPKNWQCLCVPCHAEKTAKDVAIIAKAKRREAIYLGAKAPPTRPIVSPGFAPGKKKREAKPMPPRRPLYTTPTEPNP
jgi:5-methylcytosine-specific restriction protein A